MVLFYFWSVTFYFPHDLKDKYINQELYIYDNVKVVYKDVICDSNNMSYV